LNRKEALVIGVLLLTSYFGGVYGATTGTAITNVFVTNFPHNQNVTVTNFPKSPSVTQQTGAVDIEILSSVPGIFASSTNGNFTAGFSFIPHASFMQLTSAVLTLEWSGSASQGHIGDRFAVQLNGQSAILSQPMSTQATMLLTLPANNVPVGANQINIYVIPSPGVFSDYLLYEVRLTVGYNYLG
jgi:hypothetical protein